MEEEESFADLTNEVFLGLEEHAGMKKFLGIRFLVLLFACLIPGPLGFSRQRKHAPKGHPSGETIPRGIAAVPASEVESAPRKHPAGEEEAPKQNRQVLGANV